MTRLKIEKQFKKYTHMLSMIDGKNSYLVTILLSAFVQGSSIYLDTKQNGNLLDVEPKILLDIILLNSEN